MIFQEKKVTTGYTYDVQDVFGTIHIESGVQLEPDILDGMVVLLLKQNITAQTINGTVKHAQGVVSYTFTRAPLWEDDKEPCESTPTSTDTPESASTRTPRSPATIWYWCKRFVGAFREAWRKTT
jgi:hypothetical protein